MRDINVELTYAEVARQVDAAAGQFAAAGVGLFGQGQKKQERKETLQQRVEALKAKFRKQ